MEREGSHTEDMPEGEFSRAEPVPKRLCTFEASSVNIAQIISEYFPAEAHAAVKGLLKEVLTKKLSRKEMLAKMKQLGIEISSYNSLILKIVEVAVRRSKSQKQRETSPSEENTLRIKGALKEQFLLEVKRDMEDPLYNTKSQQQYSFYKRTPEDLSNAVSSKPHLIALFSANYNVLCCKIKKILSIRELHNRLKKGSFEYKLNEQVSVEAAKCAYTTLIHYIKEMIGKCLDVNNRVDREKLIRTMFGNVRGVYLLYNNYPPTESPSDKAEAQSE
ncbi:uncharacterized protein NEMAJ01_0225 [Nematocida major]|uniref:uncharacterized protein n=1 Tax=Nematocida major TaxID=1912982 RepID=UPI002007E155|nr:uncharacterized protein NEMAJ01_0225 [Nematocida major]KAH9385329.1 hypothetical protein NEMAJ01_0225 [Nematocida major]